MGPDCERGFAGGATSLSHAAIAANCSRAIAGLWSGRGRARWTGEDAPLSIIINSHALAIRSVATHVGEITTITTNAFATRSARRQRGTSLLSLTPVGVESIPKGGRTGDEDARLRLDSMSLRPSPSAARIGLNSRCDLCGNKVHPGG